MQENSVVIPNVIGTTTDQLNLGLEYTHRKFFVQAGYYGSIFKNNVSSMAGRIERSDKNGDHEQRPQQSLQSIQSRVD